MIIKNCRLSQNYKDFDRIENPFTMSVYKYIDDIKRKDKGSITLATMQTYVGNNVCESSLLNNCICLKSKQIYKDLSLRTCQTTVVLSDVFTMQNINRTRKQMR